MGEITIAIMLSGDLDYKQLATMTMNELKNKGFKSYSHLVGTNIVLVELERASELPNIINDINGLKNKPFFYVWSNPIAEIIKSLSIHDYFKAFALCTAIYESDGKRILSRHFKNKGSKVSAKQVRGWSLYNVILMLYTQGLIKENTYCDMISVNEARNELIHTDVVGQLSKAAYEKIVQNTDKVSRSLETLQELDRNTPVTEPRL